MAASGATPIITYHSTTPSQVPSNANLSPGELAINIADMKLYAENASGVVTLLADAAAQGSVTSVAVSGGTTGLTTSGGPITSAGTITLAGTLAVTNGGTGLTAFGSGVGAALGENVTGTGGIALATSPTFVTPILGNATATQLNLTAQGDLRFEDASGGQYVGFQAPATVTSNVLWTLPATDGSSGESLTTNGSGTLSWATGGISTGKAIAMALIFG